MTSKQIRQTIRLRQKPFLIILLLTLVSILLMSTLDAIYIGQHNTDKYIFQQVHRVFYANWRFFPTSAYFNVQPEVLWIISLVWGWLTAVFNNQGRFYSFLISSGTSRLKIFKQVRWENSWPILLFVTTYWLITFSTWTFILPWQTLNLGKPAMIMILIVNILMTQACWLLTFLIGLFFANPFSGLLIVTFSFWISSIVIGRYLSNIDFIYNLFELGNWQALWPAITAYIVLIVLFMLFSYLIFKYQSSESIGKVFTLPRARWPFSILMVGLLAIGIISKYSFISWIIFLIFALIIISGNFWIDRTKKIKLL